MKQKVPGDCGESQAMAGAVGPRAGKGIVAEARPPSRPGREASRTVEAGFLRVSVHITPGNRSALGRQAT